VLWLAAPVAVALGRRRVVRALLALLALCAGWAVALVPVAAALARFDGDPLYEVAAVGLERALLPAHVWCGAAGLRHAPQLTAGGGRRRHAGSGHGGASPLPSGVARTCPSPSCWPLPLLALVTSREVVEFASTPCGVSAGS
jgi:hypothetical protein